MSVSAKSWEAVSKILPQSITNYPNNPGTSYSTPSNPEIFSRGLDEAVQDKRDISAEGEQHSRISPGFGDDIELQNLPEVRESSQRTSISSRAASLDTRSIYEGWLLETSSNPQKQPPFAIFCCSQMPANFRPVSPRWIISPFSRDTSTLKPRIENPSQLHSALNSLPTDARDEINDLLRDRNDYASREYGWRVAAISSYSSPITMSEFFLRKRSKDKEPKKYLIILRGGLKPSGRETEELPDRYSNPWRQRHPRGVVSPYRYRQRIRSRSRSRGYGEERMGRPLDVFYDREPSKPPTRRVETSMMGTLRQRFPEDPQPIREGVQPQRDDFDDILPPHHAVRRHGGERLAEGALAGAGAGAAARVANGYEKQRNEPGHRVKQAIGGAALGALAAEVQASRGRSRSRSRHRYDRDRERDRKPGKVLVKRPDGDTRSQQQSISIRERRTKGSRTSDEAYRSTKCHYPR
ncbi:hypothetical protein N431DRAFT_104651 [Stipitochalara longipes BDJ]|nr:hypothetical protein N431DRAFT_104651 [Stipitochalara longipes BDJ]